MQPDPSGSAPALLPPTLTAEQVQQGLVLAVDKPVGWTSFQAVARIRAEVRRQTGLKKFKIGHAGTLDPLASGLLLIAIGRATKLIPELQSGDKSYTGTLVLGATTPSFDLERPIDAFFPFAHLTHALVAEAASRFEGDIMQVPPIFSAVKVDGQRAYTYARADDPSATIAPKPVHIDSFRITAFRPGDGRPTDSLTLAPQPDASSRQLYKAPLGTVPTQLPQADFVVQCGKGTYVRSLARDLGLALDSGAYLASLRRLAVGAYHVDTALRLE